ncbi:MAG: class I SAM-dependent methyltransferase, partial [Planctomycetales bacterium]|nr:class I SAM-dependent methyltransferase [Planctomycetales bacterium]
MEEAERQSFAKSLRGYIQKAILPDLEPVYQARAAKRFEKETGHSPRDRHEIRKTMVKEPYFQAYAALNRIAQELLWLSVIESIDRQYDQLSATAKSLANKVGSYKVDRAFTPPNYVTALDIHCMPGGYAQNTGDDIEFAAGALYDRGVYLYSMGYGGPFNDDKGRSVVNYIKRNLKEFAPKTILDMGCAIGHSTLPYKELFPDAKVFAIDVTEPLVTYAHLRAAGLGVDITYEQRNAEDTGYPDASFDLVVSHILLHETSGKALPRVLKECHRLLK